MATTRKRGRIMKHTKQQENYIKAGATLCIECKRGFNGDKSCGCNGMVKLPKSSPSGCFCGEKMEESEE